MPGRAKSAFNGADAKEAVWTASDPLRQTLESSGEQVFRGYDTTTLNSQVLALFDSNPLRLARAREVLGGSPRTYQDLDALFAAEKPDTVIVCTRDTDSPDPEKSTLTLVKAVVARAPRRSMPRPMPLPKSQR